VQHPPSATTRVDAGKRGRRDTFRHIYPHTRAGGQARQVAEGVDLVVDASTPAGSVIWEERPFSPILPVAVLLVRTKSQGDSGHEQRVNERQKEA
jgi:hypothetical protein